MPVRIFFDYVKSIDILVAEEQLSEILSTTYPNLKPSKQKELQKGLLKRTKNFVAAETGKKELKLDDIAAELARKFGSWKT